MRNTIRILSPYLRKYRKGILSGLGALVLRNVASVGVPLLIRSAVDQMSAHFSIALAVGYGLALIGISFVKGVFHFGMRVILISVSRDIEFELRNDIFSHLIGLSGGFYSRFRTGDIMARATNDLNSVRNMLGPGIMYTADTVLTALLAICVMGWFDWRLTAAAILPAPLVTATVIIFGRYIRVRFKKIQGIFSDISSRVQENLTGVRVVRAFVQEEAENRNFTDLNKHYVEENLRLARAAGFFGPLLQSLTAISFLLVLWYGGLRLLEGAITLGGFLMFNVFLGYLIWPMIAMGWVTNMMQRGTASLIRIHEMLQERSEITSPAAPVVLNGPVRGGIELRDAHVRFGDREVLRGISCDIPAGSTVAIVGHTGSGKSTLVQLIPRLLDPSSGSVQLDGVDLRNYDVAELRRQVGFVPQETFLFSATLAENIAFGVETATSEQIRWAAEAAGLEEDIAGFPDGYDTMLGERGITLSGGQKQRTAIARALLRNPPILILDDALSSVDTLTEESILSALAGVMRERTTIFISHRVSTIRHAQRIYVLEAGRIVEQGTHDELLALGRYYADLHQKQLLEDELEAI